MKTLGWLLRIAHGLSCLWRLTCCPLAARPALPAREPVALPPDIAEHAQCRSALTPAMAASTVSGMAQARGGTARDRKEELLLRALRAEAPHWRTCVPPVIYRMQTKRLAYTMTEIADIPGYDILGTIPTHWLPLLWN